MSVKGFVFSSRACLLPSRTVFHVVGGHSGRLVPSFHSSDLTGDRNPLPTFRVVSRSLRSRCTAHSWSGDQVGVGGQGSCRRLQPSLAALFWASGVPGPSQGPFFIFQGVRAWRPVSSRPTPLPDRLHSPGGLPQRAHRRCRLWLCQSGFAGLSSPARSVLIWGPPA